MQIVVTHLTRMKSPYVCVAGVDSGGYAIRPVLESGQLRRLLLASQGGPFSLGAVVKIGDPRPRPVRPEVEDVVFEPRRTTAVDSLDVGEFQSLLDDAVSGTLRSIFGPALERRSATSAALPERSGRASLGVLRLDDPELAIDERYEPVAIRLHFTDPELGELSIKVTDLRLWEVDQVTPSAADIERIEHVLEGCLVAVGLSRKYSPPSYEGAWHWLQINNIYPVDDPLWTRE